MPAIFQKAFSGGELAPSLFARADLTKFDIGAKTLENFFVHAHGGISNRAGLKYIYKATANADVRLTPFEFSTTQTYILMFSPLKMRVLKDGGIVLNSSTKTITAATQANPVVVTSNSHGLSNGDEVYITGVVGMTEINGRFFKIANVATNTFELTNYITGANINGTGYTSYSSAGTAASIFELTTPYTADDISALSYVQSADTLYLASTAHAPRKMTRTAHDNWTLTTITFVPSISAPGSLSTSGGGSGSESYSYKITARKEETEEESAPSAVVTASSKAALSSSNTLTVSWGAVTDADRYNVYKLDNGLYGFIGATETTSFVDDNIDPDTTDSPPSPRTVFNSTNNYPGAVGLHQQRSVWGGTLAEPQKTWMSQSSNFENMNVSSPTKSDDSVTFQVAARQVNAIRHYISLRDMVQLTSGGEWVVSGGEDVAITPANVTVQPQSYRGSSTIPPIVVGNIVLYVEDDNRTINDLGYKFDVDGYVGDNLTVLVPHIFENVTIVDWAYAQSPDTVVWVVLSDGTAAGLTYMREQQVFAWHRHTTTDGDFKGVATIREGNDDVPYFLVERRLAAATTWFVERMESREILDVKDSFFLDSGLSLDSPVTITGATQANPVVITAASHGFSNGDEVDITDVRGMTELNGYRFKVANQSTNTFELQDLSSVNINGTSYTKYVDGGEARLAVLSVSGLWHLEGDSVSIVADGSVVPAATVSNGAITLPNKASRIQIGLGYSSTLETLPISIDLPTGSAVGRRKSISKVHIRVHRARGIFAGFNVDNLVEYKQRAEERYGEPTQMETGVITLNIKPNWNREGTIAIRQKDPLPVSILGLAPEIHFGGY